MKIIHLSDTHIDPEILHKIDAQDRFKLALNHIKNNHTDADHLMITGDLTHFGNNKSYQIFSNILSEAKLPYHLNPKLIIGNHDDRENFKMLLDRLLAEQGVNYNTSQKDRSKKFRWV